MKYFCFFIGLLLGLWENIAAQVVIQPQLPSPGVFAKSQLWNLAVLNSYSHPMNVRIVMTISDLQSNQLVLSGTSRFFILNQGAAQVSQQMVSPISYQAVNSNYPVDPQPDGFLPVGIFTVCYTIFWQNNDGLETVAEQCETLEVEPLSPPQLILPDNQDKITETHPFFTWSAPMSTTLLSGLRYDWKLVEVLPYQSAGDAIQQNIPVWFQRSLSTSTFQYPMAQPKLDSSKLYAWQVTALNNLSPVSSSDIWTFKVGTNMEPAPGRKRGTYADLKSAPNGQFFLIDGDVQFTFNNQSNQPLINIMVYDLKNGRRLPLLNSPIQLPVIPGKNYLRIPASAVRGLKKNHPYLLEVTETGKKLYLKFQLTSTR